MKSIFKRLIASMLAILLLVMAFPYAGHANTSPKVQVWLTKNKAGEAGDYIVGYTNGNSTLAAGSELFIQFPEGTVFSKNKFDTGDISLNGAPLATVIPDATNRVVVIPLASEIPAGGYAGVVFSVSAGILNPLSKQKFQISVKSTNDQAYIFSDEYEIIGTEVTNPSIEVANLTKGAASDYSITFRTGAQGALQAGDRIYIEFPAGFTLPNRIAASAIRINGRNLSQQAELIRGGYVLTLPTGVAIANNGEVTVQILSQSGVKNPNTVGAYSVKLYTSKDSIQKVLPSFMIGEQAAAVQLSLSPNTHNQAGQYFITFKTSTTGALTGTNSIATTDSIEVTFPVGTSVPTTNFSRHAYINGQNVASVKVNKQVVTFYLADKMNIAANEVVSLLISPEANIKNPSVGNNYRLQLRTSKDTAYVYSQYYAIAGSTSNPTNPPPNPGQGTTSEVLKLSSTDAGTTSSYQFTYRSGSQELVGGKDEINIIFVNPYYSQAKLPEFIDRNMIKVNNVAVDTGLVRIDERTVSFRIPSRLTIKANSSSTITIDTKAEIKHPSQAGNYTILISNSKDGSMSTYSYEIKGESSYDLYATPKYDNDKQIREYDFTFKTSLTGSLKEEYDWISLWLPRTVTREYFMDHFEVYVNSLSIDVQKVQVTGQNVTFLVPKDINIPAATEVYVKLKDPNNYLGSSSVIQFKVMTSKDSNWVDSNVIKPELRQITDPPKTNKPNPTQPNTQNPVVEQPEPEETPKKVSKIQLFLGSKDVYLDGMRASEELMDAPYTAKGKGPYEHTMVPLRFVSETLGAKVNYIPDGKKITITYQNKYIVLTVDSVDVTGLKEKLPVPVQNPTDGITFVPLRFISEWMGLKVDWIQDTESIILQK